MKVSIDFDDTLDKISVQKFVKRLITLGVECWIVTGRYSDSILRKIKKEDPNSEKLDKRDNNDDLYEVADSIGISKDHIHFCNKELKYSWLKGKKFIWHLDDWPEELQTIKKYTDIIPIDVYSTNWKNRCLKLLNLDK